MRFILFFGVLLAVLTGLCIYVHRHAADTLGLARRGRRVLAGVLAGSAVLVVLTRVLGNTLPDSAATATASLGLAILLAVLVSSVLLFVGVDLPRSLLRVARASARLVHSSREQPATDRITDTKAPSPSPEAATPPEAATTRRGFVTTAAASSALLVGCGSSAYGSLFGRHDYVIEEVVVKIPGLPRTLEGFTLVQLSDIHLGTFVGQSEMRAALELTRRARPDMVVLTGDLIDHDPRYVGDLGRLARRLGELAPRGVTAIPGNHDYFTGIGPTLGALKRAGADVLRNSGRLVGDDGGHFALLGVDDVWARRRAWGAGPDLDRAMADLPDDAPRILLCHNPVFFPEAAGRIALQLSGHTHGGQFNLGVRPADLVLPYGYVEGEYTRDGSKLYVNRGFGTAGPPARLGAAPEVTRVVLIGG